MLNKKLILGILIFVSFLIILYLITLASKYSKISTSEGEIAVLKIDGVIIDSEDILNKIRDIKNKENIKAVLVRIDSPGGAVTPSQEIYEELKKLDKEKPVISSMGSVAASGGYYIALGSRFIIANPGTITGSIGVIMQLAYLKKLYEFIKVDPYVIKSGEYKDIGSAIREMTPKEHKLLQDLSNNIHTQFKKAVSESRKIPMDIIDNMADGRIFSGEQAYDLGLVDHLGTFEDGIRYTANLIGIKKEPKLYYPQKESFNFKDLFTDVKTFINKLMLESKTIYPLFI